MAITLIIRTKYKIALARFIQKPIVLFRKSVRLPAEVRVKRSGIVWDLNLNEGIDFAIYMTGKFEPDTNKKLFSLLEPGNIALDIGANIGAHTLSMAQAVGNHGKVIAFEPTEYAFDKLTKNVRLNQNLQDNIILNQIMLVASKSDLVPENLYSSWPLNPKNQHHKKHLGAMKKTVGAQTKTLDQYIKENKIKNVKIVKIDVDGFEIDVLRGGVDFFVKQKPTVIMELAPYTLEERGKSLNELLDVVKEIGYSFYDQKSSKPLAMDTEILKQQVPEGGSINVIVAPV